MELKDSECVEWKYVNYMKNIFQSIGLDYYYYGNFNTNYITLRTFMEINFRKMFIQGQVIGSS
jgi:hypothetical protein